MLSLTEMNNQGTSSSSQYINQNNANGSGAPIQVAADVASYVSGITTLLDDRLKQVELQSSATIERLNRAEDKIDDSKNQNIQSLGLFVALFTFISIEFSLFKEVVFFSEAISLTLIVSGLLILFVLLLHIIMKSSVKIGWWISLDIVLLTVSILLIYLGFSSKYFIKDDPRIKPTPIPSITITPILTPIVTLSQRRPT